MYTKPSRYAILALVLLMLAAMTPHVSAARQGVTLTIVAGTPIRLATETIYADRILIQMAHGGSGIGYVMLGVPSGTTPSTSTWPVVELTAASSTSPGGAYSDGGVNIDLSKIWVDGSNSGDKVTVTWESK